MIKHLLFPFDFSNQANLAVPFVRSIADTYKAQLTLLSVVPPVWDAPSFGIPMDLNTGIPVGVDSQQMERDLKARLAGALTDELAGVCVQRITDVGDPASRIVEFAHSSDVDLIMMPTHGCGLFRSLLIGSVTAKVLHDAKCPVWTAAHAEKQQSRDMPRTVLCAVDDTPKTTALMQWAAEFSQRMGAALKLIHVVPPISDWLVVQAERDLQEEVREDARTKIDVLRQAAGIDSPARVAVGRIVETVTEEARQEKADLLIIGRGSLQSTLGRLRTHAYGIIQRSPCPVISV